MTDNIDIWYPFHEGSGSTVLPIDTMTQNDLTSYSLRTGTGTTIYRGISWSTDTPYRQSVNNTIYSLGLGRKQGLDTRYNLLPNRSFSVSMWFKLTQATTSPQTLFGLYQIATRDMDYSEGGVLFRIQINKSQTGIEVQHFKSQTKYNKTLIQPVVFSVLHL